MVTKSPHEIKETRIQVGGGQLGTLSSTAIHTDTHGRLRYRPSFSQDQNNQRRAPSSLACQNDRIDLQTDDAIRNDSRKQLSEEWVDANRSDVPRFNLHTQSTPLMKPTADISYERLTFHTGGWRTQRDPNSFSTPTIIPPEVNMRLRGKQENGLNGETIACYFSSVAYPLIDTYQSLALLGMSDPNSGMNGYTSLDCRGAYMFSTKQVAGGRNSSCDINCVE